jgi:hypothetical protein
MKNTKRFLALVLALTMCIATLATVSAATSTAWYSGAVEYLESCGIDTIGTKASQKITRNDFVYWLAKVVTRQVADGAWDEVVLTDELTFSDVTSAHHYAAIAHSQQMGWLKGDGDNKFYPDKALTLAELSAMVVRVMGYENKVTGLTADWKYNYMLVANLYCNAFDATFMAQTGTADPDYELSYGEAAYILATIMNFPGKPATALESLTADGYDLGAWFEGNTAGTSTYTAVVSSLDFVIETNANGINHTTGIIDEEGDVDLVFTYADGSQETVTMEALDFQGYIRVSQGLPAEVDWRNEESYRLDAYVTIGTVVSVKVDNATGEYTSIKILDGKVVDTFAVLKATGLGAKYVPWLANKTGSGDYTFELPTSYTDDVHFDFVDVVYDSLGNVTSAAFQIGGETYKVSSTSVGANNLVFYSLVGLWGYGANVNQSEEVEEALATPLTAAEVFELLPTTARGMARFVVTDVDGDGYFDEAVITDNFDYIYRSKLNANPAVGSSPNEDKSYEMGAVVAGYKVTTVTASVSTDMFGLDYGTVNNDVVLVIPATNKRKITQDGAGYLGGADGNPNGGHAMLPAYTTVKLPFELKNAYIESATSLAVDGYYRVILVNQDGTRTTAYMPIPSGTVVTTNVEVAPDQFEDVVVYKIARGWTMYRLDDEIDSIEGWYAYEDNDVYAAGELITDEYLGMTEVETKYEYVIYDYIANTTDVVVALNGTEAVVTLDSSTWVPFITDYVREADGGVNGYVVEEDDGNGGVVRRYLVNVDDTAAWMVNKYIKYAVDEDNKILFALDTTKAASQEGLIVSVDKTDTGANTYNVTLGLTTTQTTNAVTVVNYGETRWTYLRWGAWHNNTGSINVNMSSGSVAGRYLSGATNKFTENEKYEEIGIDLLAFVEYMDSQVGNVVQLSAAEGGVEQIQNARNTAAYYCNALKALREGLRALTAEELEELGGGFSVDTTFADLVGTTAETKSGERLATSVARYVIVKGTPLHYGSATTGSLEAMNNYIATVDPDAVFDLNTTLGEYLVALLSDEIIDAETFIDAFFDDGDAFEVITSTYVFEELQQACDVYMSGYWDSVKTGWTYGNNYISETLEYRGVKSVVTREVRASASSLLDWANYSAYNRIFEKGQLVHDIVVGDVLEGYHLSYGEFYQDAGDLAILKYIGEDAEGSQAHFYTNASGAWSGYYFSANNAIGDNAWESKGVMHFVSTTLSEANSLLPVTQVTLIEGPTLVPGSKQNTSADGIEYTAQYEVKFATAPYYLRTNNPAYTKYWTMVKTAVVVGTTVAEKDAEINTWLPVVDDYGNQIVVPNDSVAYWKARTTDDMGVPASYDVKEGKLYRLNTSVVPYKVDADGNAITKTTYDYDNVVDVTAVAYDVEVKDSEMKAMLTARPITKTEEGYFPGAYIVTFEGESYIASKDAPIIVMAPDYKTGNVVGKAWTPAELYANNVGVWATRQMVSHADDSLNAITVIGETVSLNGVVVPVDPGEPQQPTTTNRTVFIANGESVIEQLETGRSYVVKSLYSAIELPTGNEVGSISVPYSTYVEAKAKTTIEPVINAGKFYFIDKENVIVSESAVTWSNGTITKAQVDGTVTAKLNNNTVDYEGKDIKWAFFYMDLDHTYLALASDSTAVTVGTEATAKTAVTSAQADADKAKAAYESAVAKGLSAAKVASYKEAYEAKLAAVTAASENAVAKYFNGTFWGVENSPAYNYLVIGKLLYQDDPDPITFKYTVMGGVYCVIVNSFFNPNFKF